MNMLAVTDLATARRVELVDLDAMPPDRVAIYAARRELSTRDYGVWTILREHLWEYGSLPVGLRALAKIAGIGAASFERAAPKLAAHFDRTPQGAWTDDFLMGQRGTSLVVPSPELPTVKPALSAVRSASGSVGGLRSAARRREAADARRAAADQGGSVVLLQNEAKPEAKIEANGTAADGDFACHGEANGSLAPGWLVGSNPHLSSKTNQPTACASEAKSLEANGGAFDTAAARDARMIKAIRDACPGKIEASTAGWGLTAVKAWIAKGCSFEADYLPVLKTFGATNKTVKNVANSHIEAEAFRARDTRLAGDPPRQRPDLSRATPETRALHAGFEKAVGADAYLGWGTKIEVLEIVGDIARLGVPTRFVKTWLESNLARELTAAARSISTTVARVAIEVRAPATG